MQTHLSVYLLFSEAVHQVPDWGWTSCLINQCICYFQEAMRQVPDCEDEPAPEVPPVTPPKKKRRTLVQVKPLPPAGKGILISPGFRCIKVCTQICQKLKIRPNQKKKSSLFGNF